MGGITSALLNSASALSVFGQTFNVIENNITNANTPGYADQNPTFDPLPFQPEEGLVGGVASGPLSSSRNEYLEQAVRTQQQLLGSAQQRATDLGQIEPLFDLTSTSGVASSIDNFFNSFSQLSVNPNDSISRQGVLTAAGQVAQGIQSAAAGITQVSTNITSQTTSVVSQINQLASQIAGINKSYQSNVAATQDAGLDAQMHSALENLAQLTDIGVIKDSTGAFNVTIGGQTPLVIGSTQESISVGDTSNQTLVLDSQGNDITFQIRQGQLGAPIAEKNTTLPGYMSSLNTLAQSFADAVNGQLAQGVDQNGNTPSTPLFSYDQPSDAASTITVNKLTTDQIAAASAGAPGGNGNAIAMAQLANSPVVNGFTLTQYYGNLGSTIGNDVAGATQDQKQAQDQLTQAQGERTQVSGVSLNAEAAKLLQFQQAYQAVGKLVGVLDTLTTTLMDMVH
jgi:flagellar hook-associated protein 1